MASSPAILYLNTDPGARIPGMTLAGIRRYASARGWTAEAFSSEESRPDSIGKLLVSRAPVAGCVYECCDDNIVRPSCFRGVPVVYLHAVPHHGGGIVRIPTDNAAVAAAAFRELSACHPAAFAVAGFRRAEYWTLERERGFAEKCAEAEAPCHAFGRRVGERASVRAERLAAWVAGLPRHCAVFAVNDLVATEVIAAARAAHRAIPRELTLLGVDNRLDICEASEPQISSIQIDFERAGFVAARILGGSLATKNTKKHKGFVDSVFFVAGNRNPCTVSIGPLMAVRRESTGGWGRHEPFVLDAVEMIRREACDGLTAAALARRFPCSRNLFDLRFREAVGRSVLDEILHVRLEKACTLLARTATEISAVPGLCGFRTHTALDRLFRSRFGMSMRDWRKNNA